MDYLNIAKQYNRMNLDTHTAKKTCLWLKGLPKLQPTDVVTENKRESTKIAGNWFNKGGKERQKNRAKTFPGIAKAMAEQWGGKANRNAETTGQ